MFLSHEPSDQACFSAVEILPAEANQVSAMGRERCDQICSCPVGLSPSDPNQTLTSGRELQEQERGKMLSPDANPVPISDRELRLQVFIQSAHEMSRSGKYPPEFALQLLDRAWEAQKLLWELRQHQTATSPQADWVCKSWVYHPHPAHKSKSIAQ